jgi:FkbM family methyltransferase
MTRVTPLRLRKLLRGLMTPTGRRALRHGVVGSIEHRDTRLPISPASVLDVGANRGQFLLYAMERYPGAAFHCFEPLEEARDVLKRVMPAHTDVAIYPFAASNQNGQTSFFVTHDDDSSSLRRPAAAQVEAYPQSKADREIRVETRRLDDLLEDVDLARPCLLKIDVQGAELEVLEGSLNTLDRVDGILVECSFVELYEGQALADDVIGLLRDRGFRLMGFGSPAADRSGQLLQADLVFRRGDGGGP